MSYTTTAQELLASFGGAENIAASEVRLTRLCLSVKDSNLVDVSRLETVDSVLGITTTENEFDVVFAPGVVDELYEEFFKLLSSSTKTQVTHQADPTRPAMSVQIRPGLKKSYAAQAEALAKILSELPEDGDEDITASQRATTSTIAPQATTSSRHTTPTAPQVLVINGPNINLLGSREPEHYGSKTYEALVQLCKDAAREAGFSNCRCFQSNHEGAIVDEIQRAKGVYAGIVINPAAYTHTSIAILDALKAVELPAVEVHISKVDEREDFRQISYVREACFETITGLGLEGYAKAIQALAAHVGLKS